MYFLFLLGYYIAVIFPENVGYLIATVIGGSYYTLVKADQRIFYANLMRAFDNKITKQEADLYGRRSIINFSKYLVDFFRFGKINERFIKERVTVDGREYLDEALLLGKGVIILSSHIGNWELGGAVISKLGYKLDAIALDHKDGRVTDLFVRQRQLCGVSVIKMGINLRNCFRTLRENRLLAILADRDFSEGGGISIDFFGKPAVLPKGPAAFAIKTGAPIVPSFMVRNRDNTFKLIFEKPICYNNHTNDKESDRIRNCMACYIAVIEKFIQRYPDQWHAFRKIWNE